MNIRTVSQRYDTRGLKGRPCSTSPWRRSVEWTSVRRWYARGGRWRRAIDRLFSVHAERLPSVLYPGREVSSALDAPELFPDTVFVMTGCGSQGPWDPPRAGRARLHTLIGFPSSF